MKNTRLTLEAAREGEEGKRLDLIAEAVRAVEEAEEAAGAAQRTRRRRKPGKGANGDVESDSDWTRELEELDKGFSLD